jgi:hypothetical protein
MAGKSEIGNPKLETRATRLPRRSYCRRRNFCLLSSVSCLLLAIGCTGSGVVNIVPFNRTDFREDEPLVAEIPVQEAYWWRGDEEQLNFALACHVDSILGPAYSGQWLMSMVLEGSPAGKERLYRLGPQSVRMIQSRGGDHRRARSLSGVAVIRVEDGDRFSGRFHVSVLQQTFGLLTGWSARSAQAPQIVIGRFAAFEDAQAGQAILDETECDGFGRTELGVRRRLQADTQPASRPASAPSIK